MLLLKVLSADEKKNLDFIYLDNQRSICNNLLPKEMILRYLVIVISARSCSLLFICLFLTL